MSAVLRAVSRHSRTRRVRRAIPLRVPRPAASGRTAGSRSPTAARSPSLKASCESDTPSLRSPPTRTGSPWCHPSSIALFGLFWCLGLLGSALSPWARPRTMAARDDAFLDHGHGRTPFSMSVGREQEGTGPAREPVPVPSLVAYGLVHPLHLVAAEHEDAPGTPDRLVDVVFGRRGRDPGGDGGPRFALANGEAKGLPPAAGEYVAVGLA